MKRIAIAVSLVVLFSAVSVWAQTPAPKPGPEHQKVGVLVGHWMYEGEYKAGPQGPGGKFTGEYTAQWILGGFFVQGQWAEKGPSGTARGIETFGYDSANKNYAHSMYEDDGSVGTGAISINGNTWSYLGKVSAGGKQLMWRLTVIFATDYMSLSQKAETSADGKVWAPFFEAKYTKVKPAPKAK